MIGPQTLDWNTLTPPNPLPVAAVAGAMIGLAIHRQSTWRAILGCALVVAGLEFVGGKFGDELATLLNQHRIMVVPSRWPEPFGLVALEGIACGCAVGGSEEGGLKEAMGPCGISFKNSDYSSLAAALDRRLRRAALPRRARLPAPGAPG